MKIVFLLLVILFILPSIVKAAVCGKGGCQAGENYENCPEDCCNSYCTDINDVTCHSDCNGFKGCSINSFCNEKQVFSLYCYGNCGYIECCDGSYTTCEGHTCFNGYCTSTCSEDCDADCEDDSDCIEKYGEEYECNTNVCECEIKVTTTSYTTSSISETSTTTTTITSTTTATTTIVSSTTTTTSTTGSTTSISTTISTTISETASIETTSPPTTTTVQKTLKLIINSPQENDKYTQTESIEIIGNVYDEDDDPFPSVPVKIIITGPESWKTEADVKTDSSGMFYYQYSISFGDPIGQWDLIVIATDEFGNQEIEEIKISVKASEIIYYQVEFIDPQTNATYERGNQTLIETEVSREGRLIEDATVTCKSPTGSVFKLTEDSNGIYSGEYEIKFTDPAGIWSLTCEARKIEVGEVRYGGSFVNVIINPVNLKINLIDPKMNELKYGEKIDFILVLRYPNDEPVSDATVSLKFQGEDTALSETEMGMYEATTQVKKMGQVNAVINAEDLGYNVGRLETSFVIKTTLLGFLKMHWYLIPISLGSTFFAIRFFKMRLPQQIKECEKRLKELEKVKKSTQKEYFMRKIDEKTFKNMMEDYKKSKLRYQVRLKELRKKLKKRESQYEKLREKWEKKRKERLSKKV